MKIKLAIFDLDGTLLDTFGDLTAAVNASLAAFGFPARREAEVKRFVGDGVKKLIERAVPDGVAEAAVLNVYRRFLSEYDARKSIETRPYAGVAEILELLKRKGVKLAVLSNKPDAAAKSLIARFFPDFDYVAGETEGIPRKPDPRGALEIMSRFGAERGETVLIGDSGQDAETALNAGIGFIAVLWGARNLSDFDAYRVSFFATRPDALLKRFQSLRNP